MKSLELKDFQNQSCFRQKKVSGIRERKRRKRKKAF